jgi:hypothetical protein
MSENMVGSEGIFLPNIYEVTLHNDQHLQIILDDYIKENEMDGTCSMHG